MSSTTHLGAAHFTDGTGEYNASDFIARMVMGEAVIATLVKIVGVNGNAVNVLPLVNQVDGLQKPTPHGQVNGLPWMGLQAGQSAVELTPVVGDIGLAIFCDKDISSVVKNKAQANPGSARRFSYSDGIYCFGIQGINATPTQFVKFLAAAAGVTITTPGTLTINAGGGKTWTFGTAGFTMSDSVVAETHGHDYYPGGGGLTRTVGNPIS